MIPFCLEMTFDPNSAPAEWQHALPAMPEGWSITSTPGPFGDGTYYCPVHSDGEKLPIYTTTRKETEQTTIAWFELDRAEDAVRLALTEEPPLMYTRERYEEACLAADVPPLSELQVAQHYQSDRAFPVSDYPARVVIAARLATTRGRGLFAELDAAQRSARKQATTVVGSGPLSRSEYERGCAVAEVEALPDAEVADIGAWHAVDTENVRSVRAWLAVQRYRGLVSERPERCCVVCGQWQPPIVGRSCRLGVVCVEHLDIALDA
ncbi:hypothetical protein FHX42_005298 [Saccharopolyspora lacisalsi]|uniref:Uncharacterized protein n=1 Tax=Halosaccharopolyspora lacisalsi TaxID=1000566 RepID=A0A839E9F4_9PSEU|nr:hypothetical protein [Halosaccharopolyspora lacisalsi]MBA8827891.1 hypothetical protein [Halosaccharopolyspora lacisalsi]